MLAKTLQAYLNTFRGLSRDIWLLSLVMFINRSGTMVILFLTIYLTQYLHFTLGQAGVVMSCFGLGSILGSYLGGWLTDRIGYYRVMFWSLILSGSFFFVVMQIEDLVSFCLVIFLLSTISDAFRPANLAAISAYSKAENYTRSISLIRLAINLGFAAAPAVGGLLAATVGYRWLFILDGLTCVLAAFAFLVFLKEKHEAGPENSAEPALRVNQALRDQKYLIFLGLMLLTVIPFMQILTTAPVFYKEILHMSEDQIGLLFAANGLIIVLFEMPLVYWLEKRLSALQLAGLGALFVGLAYMVLNLFPAMIFAAAVSILALTIGEMINFPFSNTFAVSRSEVRNRGQYMGLFTMMFSVAHVVAPASGLWVAEVAGYDVLWYAAALLCLLSALGMVWLGRTIRRQEFAVEGSVY